MRGRILFIVAVVAFVGVVPLVYWALFERGLSVATPTSPAPRPPAGLEVELVDPPQEQAPLALSLTEIDGQVEITHGQQGGWQAAELGMVLAARDRIRTRIDARATLAMPGMFSVRLMPDSEFLVRQLAENAVRFLLDEGMISADVRYDPEQLFEVAASSAVATTRGGRFRMHVDQTGSVVVGANRGTLDLESGDEVVQVREGFQARAEAGRPPQDPIRIPNRLFLKVSWPRRRDLSARKLALAGRTVPGARVRIDGVTVEVDARGNFRTLVALEEGRNRVRVESSDMAGQRAVERSPPIRVDTRGDSFEIRTSPQMWQKRLRRPRGGDPD